MSNVQLMAMIAGAGTGNDAADRFLEGDHIVALNELTLENSQDHGQFIAVTFLVIESTVPGYAGKECGEAYFYNKSDKEGGKGAKQRLNGLGSAAVASLGGNPEDLTPAALANGVQSTAGIVLVQNTLAEMMGQGAPWRGLMLRATARKRVGKNSGKEYVAVKYAAIPQTAKQIGEVRQRIEQAVVASTNLVQGVPTAPAPAQPQMVAPAPAPAPMVAYQPAPAAAPAAAPVQPFGLPSLLNR